MDPTELNRLVLYTLNHFTEWVPPHLTIATPPPCSAKSAELLTLMTISVSSTYNKRTYCTSLKDESYAASIYRIIRASGLVSLAIFKSVASIVLLQVLLKALSQKMEFCNYSFDYGMFWGMLAILNSLHALHITPVQGH